MVGMTKHTIFQKFKNQTHQKIIKMKPYILIVEDEAIVYDGISQALLKEHFLVSDYTKSYEQAINRIEKKRPDLVLLDIDLQGEKDGLDLGKILSTKYKIPFIYLTNLDDDRIFNKGLQTNHEHFMVKAKPELNSKEIIRAIDTVLNKQKEQTKDHTYILALTNTYKNIKQFGKGTISKIPVAYQDIVCFKTIPSEKDYSKLITKNNDVFVVKHSLSKLKSIIPNYFIRINEWCLLNISPQFLNGRINGNILSVLDETYTISPTFKKEVEACIKRLYQNPS